jgi:hypothetical protein
MTSPMRAGRRAAYRVGFSVAVLLCLGGSASALWQTFGDQLIDDGWSPRLAHASASGAGRQIVTRALIEGRVTFADAIERFRNLSKHNPYFSWNVFGQAFPGATSDECFGRQVIAFVAHELRNKPDRAQAMISGLQTQLYASSSASSLPPTQ